MDQLGGHATRGVLPAAPAALQLIALSLLVASGGYAAVHHTLRSGPHEATSSTSTRPPLTPAVPPLALAAAYPRPGPNRATAARPALFRHDVLGSETPTVTQSHMGTAASMLGLLGGGCAAYLYRRRRGGERLALRATTPEQAGGGEVGSMVNALRRTAWVPFVEGAGPRPALSRFGGSPALPPGEEWPRCALCDRALTLFLQLDLSTIPPEKQPDIAAEGVLQVFVCAVPDSPCLERCCDQRVLPATGSAQPYLVRILPNRDLTVAGTKNSTTWFEPMSITYWHAVDDYPRTVAELLSIYPQLATSDRLAAWDTSNCSWGEKMGGWPLWGAAPRYLRCEACDCDMNVIFQFDSDCNLDHVWGKNGTAFVHRCPHCQRLGFSWVDNSSM
eukprot:EG_transcript_9016